MFNLEDILGPALDGMGDGVAVGRAQHQRPEDQHVQSPLEHLAFQRRLASWHPIQYTPVDHLPEVTCLYTLHA